MCIAMRLIGHRLVQRNTPIHQCQTIVDSLHLKSHRNVFGPLHWSVDYEICTLFRCKMPENDGKQN